MDPIRPCFYGTAQILWALSSSASTAKFFSGRHHPGLFNNKKISDVYKHFDFHTVTQDSTGLGRPLTLIVLMWRIGRAHNNARK